MPQATPSFGLTPDELQRLVCSLMGRAAGTSDEIDAVPPAIFQARRAALEAAAALLAVNNRRLTEQLSQLGVAAVSPPQPALPAQLTAVYRGGAQPGAERAHD